jgi:hypothetical protein
MQLNDGRANGDTIWTSIRLFLQYMFWPTAVAIHHRSVCLRVAYISHPLPQQLQKSGGSRMRAQSIANVHLVRKQLRYHRATYQNAGHMDR